MREFLAQGGYAFYVWTSYGLAAALLIAEAIGLQRQRRTIFARLGRLIRMQAHDRG
jgi:heme exporter protein D